MTCIKCGESYADDEGTPVHSVTEAWLDFPSEQDDALLCIACVRSYGEAG